MTQSGKIQAINGLVTARTPDGQVRELKLGDLVYENEIIETSNGATISIIQLDGNMVALEGNDQIVLDESVNSSTDPSDSVIDEVTQLQEAIVEAIQNDQDIDDLLEETAAGEEADTGGANDSHDFVSGYYGGDASKGLVGTYLLDAENRQTGQEYEQYVGDEPDENDGGLIEDINDAPTIIVSAASLTENGAVQGDIAGTYVVEDEDGDALTVDFTPGSNDDGYYALVDGEVVLTPDGAAHVNNGGTLPAIDLTVSDGELTGTGSDTPAIVAVNDAPSIVVTANDFTENSAGAGQVAGTYVTEDEDGDTLTVDFTPGSNGDGYYALVGGQVVLTPDGAAHVNNGGTLPAIDLIVSDGELTGTGSDTPAIVAVNDAPSIVVTANDFTENSAGAGQVAGTYVTEDEDGDTLTVDFTPGSNGDGYYALVGGQVVLTPDGAAHVNNGGTLPAIDLTVSDGELTGTGSDTPAIVAVNDAPSIVVTANDFTENSAGAGQVAGTYVTEDEDGDTLTVDFTPGSNGDGYYALVGGQVVLTPDGAAHVNNGGTLPAIDLTVSDGELTGTGSDTPAIVAVNDAPSIVVTANDFTENSAGAGQVAGTYVTEDEDGDALTVDFTPGSNDDGYYALVDGEVVLTPDGAAHVNNGGTLPAIDLTVSDGELTGTGSDTPAIVAVNDAPSIVVTANDFTENSAGAGQVAGTYVTEDEDGDTLTVDFTPGSNGDGYYALVGGQVVLTPDGAAHVNNGGTLPAIDLTVSDGELTGTGSVEESGDTYLTYEVKLSNAVAEDVAVSLSTSGTATAGSDYSEALRILLMAATGSQSAAL